MATLLPAILTNDLDELREKIALLEGIPEVTEVHIDFEDGRFVPNTTLLPSDLIGLSTRLKIDAHMMVENPVEHINSLEQLRVDTVDLHFESFPTIAELMVAIGNLRALSFKTAVVLNPESDISIFNHLNPAPDIMFLMSVHPGFQGRPFLPGTLDRLEALRKKFPGAVLQIDGGISMQNIDTARAFGADRIVVGSGIWKSLDIKSTILQMIEKIK